MTDENSSAVVPQRTLLGEVNEQITCPLCRGYYIDATTIVECLHSFCRSCIIKHLQVKSYCPVCEMMINSAKPNIKLDKALQDIVYKLVPGLFQKEMERRQTFYASRPGPAACATPEQRGEDTERIIFSPEDVISFSLEYADATDADSISSKSSDSNEPPIVSLTTRRYLQCPAVVNINHLKKFLSMKFDIDSTQFAIDILYKRVPLPDYYTLMDIAYIYNWKRNEPMRFFYQIIDYVAIRNRLFDINRKGTHFPDRKSSPTCTEDTTVNSPAPNINDQGSEASSGTDSPMPDESNIKKAGDTTKKDIVGQKVQDINVQNTTSAESTRCSSPVKNDDEVEKSQFLISFELTAKSASTTSKSPSSKTNASDIQTSPKETPKSLTSATKAADDTLKRKFDNVKTLPEIKKIKIEIEKAKIPLPQTVTGNKVSNLNDNLQKPRVDISDNGKNINDTTKAQLPNTSNSAQTINQMAPKDIKTQQFPTLKQHLDNSGHKRQVAVLQTILSPKRKASDAPSGSQPSPVVHKTVSPLKLQIPKPEIQTTNLKHIEFTKPVTKKMPDLKPSIPTSSNTQHKGPTVGKLRMDLLANNCDPTIDRSKILSQVKTSLPAPSTPPSSGDPLKSLFDSCKINIPSSLSITLTDQKLDPRSPSDPNHSDPKKNVVSKNLPSASSASTHKVPNNPVHNYIEILKLPDSDPKKLIKPDVNTDKANVPIKLENNAVPSKPPTKSSETSAKGPVPNLKPISDTKLGKQSGNFASPITFQQTFEQQLKALKSDKKSKLPKNKTQVPKLVPATPKSLTAANIIHSTIPKPNPTSVGTMESKALALDLSTPHNIHSQLGPQHTKAFETMQSIANLAKKQNIPSKAVQLPLAQANTFANFSNRNIQTSAPTLRVPSANSINQLKLDKINANVSQANPPRQDSNPQNNQIKQANNSSSTIPSPSYTHNSSSAAQPSPRSQTRSPSSSPKLVIAEEKQASSSGTELNINQSNQITSTQLSNTSTIKVESPKASPGPSKAGIKSVKLQMPQSKGTGIRQPITPTINSNQSVNSPADYLSQPQLISHAHQAMLRHQMEMQNAWLIKAHRQYDLYKMSNMSHPAPNDFNNKDKQ
ncbi:jg18499 [Pararge aegeria aegeria]|uniref:Jg18499 protein n=2 Tax=Pararge aegeria TaxID=116150 RepID=A0A8S4RMF8_9NEOP|nr:jg18499 [Pararge aegeria aegeria]